MSWQAAIPNLRAAPIASQTVSERDFCSLGDRVERGEFLEREAYGDDLGTLLRGRVADELSRIPWVTRRIVIVDSTESSPGDLA